ncbi:transcription factor HES-4 [Rhinatrema bivittatum]|uniref:transcription factor HES-4 n=1 Tax=Rhinatrema bivittatum TaxID=194408 RepID=UPI0011293D7E|nr:transcription factor HES-4 [Rhinatrema bivittatum]
MQRPAGGGHLSVAFALRRKMPADTMEKPSASPMAGAPASTAQTPDKPKSASEHRKSSKPIMEKRRRARINESLGQLKTLILDALKKDSSRHSKLEKADILEMTVKHLRNLQRVQMTAALSADPTVIGKYRAGFNECMNEVTRFLSTCEGVNTEVRSHLLGHLAACLGQIVAMNYTAAPAAQALPVQLSQAASTTTGPLACKLSPSEAGPPKVYGGFQLLPATDGQLAFLIPNPAFSSSSSGPGSIIPLYANVAGSPGALSFCPLAGSGSSEGGDSVWRPW